GPCPSVSGISRPSESAAIAARASLSCASRVSQVHPDMHANPVTWDRAHAHDHRSVCLGYLGYAVTAHRAQGITVDTAHVLVEPSSTRENVYVAMTRGKESSRAYVVLDRPDDHAAPHPSDNEEATGRSVLFGVLQHSGAELSAHETITAEQ